MDFKGLLSLFSGFNKREISKKRMKICKACDCFISKTNKCNECGCFMKVKVKLKKAECPMGKWESY